MWPFKSKKNKADAALAEMPRAIEIASEKWTEFEAQPFAQSMSLEEKIYLFVEALKNGFGEWKAFRDAPDGFFLLITVKGIERSKSYLRLELEKILGCPVPEPHVRSDQEELAILQSKLIERCARKWIFFEENLYFEPGTPLSERIEAFRIPFCEGLRNDFPMFKDASDREFDPIIMLGIDKTKRESISEIEAAMRRR
ncbi:hypothetical protein [Erythrobacter sp. HL-111]|uniref:hypothetical protein n=1 Tax=Erythrobacter sp. HL-111 TaxID=1798193 RepID=UPI0006DB8152|nr:hypothetical protein [Erythrobacter sp. HL-111]KPP94317.1 MAG: hypothetical protein HLUCCO15_04030 [Erythrobacteraceae bacterium HL-111]